jgi:hypothetical protein
MKVNKVTQQLLRKFPPPDVTLGRAAEGSTAADTPATELEVCEYIADVSLQLRQLSQSVNHKFLTYLLEMVFEEAFTTTQKHRK